MGRNKTIADRELLSRLADAFRARGFDGASFKVLSDTAGLRRASFYHRFPRGKTQMAEDVLRAELDDLQDLRQALQEIVDPSEKMRRLTSMLDTLYAGGRRACLLNQLAPPPKEAPEIQALIRESLDTLQAIFADVAAVPYDAQEAEQVAERALCELQGALVVARGRASPVPFEDFLERLDPMLTGSAGPSAVGR